MESKHSDDEPSLWKRFQKALLTSVSKRFSCYLLYTFQSWLFIRSFICVVSLSMILTSISIGLHVYSKQAILEDTDYCSRTYKNNIGHRSFSDQLCYPVIDAVYTWVNGSDPTWIKQMLYYKNMENNTQLSETELEALTSSVSQSRFRDNSELKSKFILLVM